jgi:autotransporter-associated beta strand protein
MSAERILDYLDGRLPDAERAAFERELSADSDLQKELEAARAIERGFESLRKIEPPPDLLAKTRRQIEAGKRAMAVPQEARGWHFPAWGWPAAAAAIVLIGAGVLAMREQFVARQREAQAQAVAAASAPQLREALERAAAKNLPEPTLAAAQIDLPAPPDKIGERADEVLRIAFAVGGTAMKGDAAPGEQRILAYIPQSQIEYFRQAVTNPVPAESSQVAAKPIDGLYGAATPSGGLMDATPSLQKARAPNSSASSTMTLSGGNTYAGGTIVNGGTIAANEGTLTLKDGARAGDVARLRSEQPQPEKATAATATFDLQPEPAKPKPAITLADSDAAKSMDAAKFETERSEAAPAKSFGAPGSRTKRALASADKPTAQDKESQTRRSAGFAPRKAKEPQPAAAAPAPPLPIAAPAPLPATTPLATAPAIPAPKREVLRLEENPATRAQPTDRIWSAVPEQKEKASEAAGLKAPLELKPSPEATSSAPAAESPGAKREQLAEAPRPAPLFADRDESTANKQRAGIAGPREEKQLIEIIIHQSPRKEWPTK